VLLTGALAAVSWSSYRTTAYALRERQSDSRKLIETQCDVRSQTVRTELDRRILQQAVSMAETRLSTVHYEATSPLGLIGAFALPHGVPAFVPWWPGRGPDPMNPPKEGSPAGPLYIPLWNFHAKDTARDLFFKSYPRNTNIEFAEALVANAD